MSKKEVFHLDTVSIRLVKDAPIFSEHKINCPEDAVALLGEILCEMDREVICVINLKSDGTPINCHFASMGSINSAIAAPRELFKASILSNASSMILVHNHPSGRLIPTKNDIQITDRLLQLTTLMGIPLTDHVIVGGDNSSFFSFKDKQLLQNPTIHYANSYETLDFEPLARVAETGRGR